MVITCLLQMTPSIPHNWWKHTVVHWTFIAILNATNNNKLWLAMDFTRMGQFTDKAQEQQVSACLNVPKPLKRRNKWSTNQQQQYYDLWMDRASCVSKCVFLLTDNHAHYDDSRATCGFRQFNEMMTHESFWKVWCEWGPDMRTTTQNKGSLVWALEGACSVVPSHLFLKSGQDRSALPAFLSQCALVKGLDNRQMDARACWSQTRILKISQQTSLTEAHGLAGTKRWVITERLGHRRDTQPPISVMAHTSSAAQPDISMYFNDKYPQTSSCVGACWKEEPPICQCNSLVLKKGRWCWCLIEYRIFVNHNLLIYAVLMLPFSWLFLH